MDSGVVRILTPFTCKEEAHLVNIISEISIKMKNLSLLFAGVTRGTVIWISSFWRLLEFKTIEQS